MNQGRLKNSAQIIDEKHQKVDQSVQVQQQDFELSVYDTENKNSVVNMLTGKLRNRIKDIPAELQDMTNEELRELVNPDGLLSQLRLRFWYAYDEAVYSGRTISMSTVCKGVCTPEVFQRIIKEPAKLAFILNPVAGYQIQVQDFLETSLYKMRKGIQDIKIENSKDLLAVLKVYEVFDKRVHGDYTKNVKGKIQVENKNEDKKFTNSQEIKKFISDHGLEGEI